VGLLGVYAGLAAEDAGAAAALIAEEIVKLAERVSETELARAKAQNCLDAEGHVVLCGTRVRLVQA
jgi:predicted Zn-dependent peptidase